LARKRRDPKHIKDLVADPHNRRTHSPRNVEMIAAALRSVGAARSIVIDEGDGVLAGNGVLEGAALAGITKLQIVDVDGDTIVAVRRRGLTEEQKRELAIYDNRTGELAEWNLEQLAADAQNGLDLKPFFFEDELKALLASADGGAKPGQTDPDEVPPARATTIVAGDLFELGSHRLLCGDSTNAGDVARVCASATVSLLVTSPPYDQQRDYTSGGDVDWLALMRGVCSHAESVLAADGSLLVNLGLVHREGRVIRYWDPWIEAMETEYGWPLFGWYVWDKLTGLMGDWRGRLAPAHEWIFHFARHPARARKTKPTQYAEKGITHYKADKVGLREASGAMKGFSQAGAAVSDHKIPDSVVRAQPARGGVEGHPAPFSVAFVAELIEAYSDRGQHLYEPFCGSGTTIIASEQLGRACHGIDIAPSYCQVAIDRWEAFTGQKAVKVGEPVRVKRARARA